MDPLPALHRLGGVARYGDLIGLGVSRRSLERLVRSGAVGHGGHGWYYAVDLDPRLILAAQCGAVVSCASAALLHGLSVLVPPSQPHVTIPPTRRQRPAGVLAHRRQLAPDDHHGLITSALRTVLDCARCLPFPEAVVVADSAVHAGLAHDVLLAAAAATRGPGSARVRRVAAAADPAAESPIETIGRLLFLGAGWRVQTQVWIDGVGRVDFLLEGFLVVEADGFEHHSSRESYRNDRRRTNALVAAGYVVLRFSYEDLVHHPERVLATVRRVLAARAA